MWQTEQAERCPGCGVWPWETDEDPDKYTAEGIHCITCAKLETRREADRDSLLKGMSTCLRLADGK